MEMAQDCNQWKFGTRLFASIHPFRTGFCALRLLLSSWDCNQRRWDTLHATHRNHRLRPVFMRGEAYASLKNALVVRLSRTSLDLGPRVSHHTSKHLIETQKLSLLLCSMRVYPTKTAGRERWRAGHHRGAWSVADNPVLRRWIAVPTG